MEQINYNAQSKLYCQSRKSPTDLLWKSGSRQFLLQGARLKLGLPRPPQARYPAGDTVYGAPAVDNDRWGVLSLSLVPQSPGCTFCFC